MALKHMLLEYILLTMTQVAMVLHKRLVHVKMLSSKKRSTLNQELNLRQKIWEPEIGESQNFTGNNK